MLKVLEKVVGTKQSRDLAALIPIVRQINELEPEILQLADQEFPARTAALRENLAAGASLESLLPEAFALAREAGRRVLGERAFDVQLMGAIVLHRGGIMEMKTGEGKTLSSVAAAYLNALDRRGVHIVTVNDYLAERDAGWMGPVFSFLGLNVGFILSQMDNDARKEAYARDITYGTNNEFGFDYLRDNMKADLESKVQRGHHFCIIDEIDSILIDEARTPLIISGAAEDDTGLYGQVDRCVGSLRECEKDPETDDYPEEPVGDYKLDEKSKRVSFTDEGLNHIEEVLIKRGLIRGSVFDNENFEHIHYFTQSLRAHKLFHRDVDYVVQEGKVEIVDEFTGRILHGRRYSDGLHQAIEAKEGIKVAQRNRTLATITFQNFFRMYKKLAGMTGTADTEAKEFARIYDLDVIVVPTNRPVVRRDNDDIIFLTAAEKYEAICDEIVQLNKQGQPILVGTVSIEKSELLSRMLTSRGVRHEVLNAKNHAREALIISEAGAVGAVTIATNMAGRGTDIKLGGNAEFRARKAVGTDAEPQVLEEAIGRERQKWVAEYERVKEAGGLHVLGTERHESRRIDNQLRGRSGRQGDPGSSRFFLSLDDDLMRLFGGENLKSLMARIGMREGEPIFHPWINKSIERAQKKVEERNFEIRKHLLEYDDVLNEQRNFIYERRDEILADGNLKERVYQTADEIVTETVGAHKEPTADAIREILQALQQDFFYEPSFDLDGLSLEDLREKALGEIRSDLERKERVLGGNLNLFIRYEYMRNIDSRWQDHLENLESLRDAVSLRTYAQKNPLLEYKLEGFQIFDDMLQDIRRTIARKILTVRIESVEDSSLAPARRPIGDARHRVLGQFFSAPQGAVPVAAGSVSGGASRPAAPQAAEAAPRSVQVTRSQPKVGRNDPCPCGSGKKYKHCHGR
jgi:preprotein translocase subunit SecA